MNQIVTIPARRCGKSFANSLLDFGSAGCKDGAFFTDMRGSNVTVQLDVDGDRPCLNIEVDHPARADVLVFNLLSPLAGARHRDPDIWWMDRLSAIMPTLSRANVEQLLDIAGIFDLLELVEPRHA